MKKFRYIFILAILSTLTLQTFYVYSQYNNFKAENITKKSKVLKQIIERELHLRTIYGHRTDTSYYYVCKPIAEDVMSEEMHKDPKVANARRINGDSLIKAGRFLTYAEIIDQVAQDDEIEDGNYLDVFGLDSLFHEKDKEADWPHRFVLRWTDGEVLAYSGVDTARRMMWTTFYPLGISGLQTLEVGMDFPVKAFLMSDGGTLLGSLGMMVLVVVILVV